VSEVLEGEGEWPFVEAAYVITSAGAEDVHRWAAELQPDEPDGAEGTWLYESPPPGAPPIPSGQHVVTLYWD
jgi:hypothetical protein